MSDAAVLLRTLTAAATNRPWAISPAFSRGIDARGEALATTERVAKGPVDAALIVALRNAADEIADLIEAAETARDYTEVDEYDEACVILENDLAHALAAVERALRPE